MLKIAFDAHPLAELQKTGIGFCEAGLVSELLKQDRQNQYQLQCFSIRNREQICQRLAPFLSGNCSANICTWFHFGLYKLICTVLPLPYAFFFRGKNDVTHFFNFYVPPGVKGKRVATVHDMAYIVYPQTVRFKTKMMLRLNLKRSCRRADRIIAVSEFTRQALIRHLDVPEEKIVVIPNGVSLETFRPLSGQDDAEKISIVKTKYGIQGEYLLYLGTLEPRKNIERLLEAYAIVKKENPKTPTLVLAGRKGWMYDTIFEKVKALNLRENVVFTDYVADGEAPLLLNGARAFLFPSLYEGFGMPVLEAMACGTPVLTSNCSALPEVAGDSALLVNPESVGEIADGIRRLCTDGELWEHLSEKGLQRAKQFTWEQFAAQLMQVYQEITG